MQKLLKIFRSPITTVALFLLAAGLLLTGSIGGTRAALTAFSQDYVGEVPVYNIGIALIENDVNITDGELLRNMIPEGEGLQLGKAYKEELAVANYGTIDEYVRVSIYRYWVDENGNKIQELSPDLIQLHFVNEDAWLRDESDLTTTRERIVLYYNTPMAPDKVPSKLFADKITIDGKLADYVKQTITQDGEFTIIKNEFIYNGSRFIVEVQADGVQTHNAEDAILSAWGRKVTISNGVMTLQ